MSFGSSEQGEFIHRPHLAISVAPSLEAIADAYVNDGASANEKLGKKTVLNLKTVDAEDSGYNREVFIKFDPKGRNRPVSEARLRLTPSNVGSTVGLQRYWDMGDVNSWSESSITWNNRPQAPLVYLGSNQPIENDLPVEERVTSAVNSAIASGRPVSIRLQLRADTGEKGFVSYRSREDTDLNRRPALVLID